MTSYFSFRVRWISLVALVASRLCRRPDKRHTELVDMGPLSLNLREFDPRVDLGTPLSIGCRL